MKTIRLAIAAGALALSAAVAQGENYTAISNTAMSITGDIQMDEHGIVFSNGEKLAFSELVSRHISVDGNRVEASVYRVETPADPMLENGNRLCGSGDVTYVASWAGSYGLTVAVFSTPDAPTADDEMCASYGYE